MVYIGRFKIRESDLEDANELHQTIDTDGLYHEDVDTK